MKLKSLIESDKKQNPLQVHPKEDMSVAQKTDTRKTRLTLEQINRLRMLSDVKITEYAKELTNIKKQYSVPVAAE
jgi:hypothetical protein|tara:strand:+ start:55 stop:279 length:225 start_codon:yes stop_codon:yes gene_type:complete